MSPLVSVASAADAYMIARKPSRLRPDVDSTANMKEKSEMTKKRLTGASNNTTRLEK